MSRTKNDLIDLVEHIDLPGHDRVVSKLKLWVHIPPVLSGLAAAAFWGAIIWWLRWFEGVTLLALMALIFAAIYIFNRYGQEVGAFYRRKSGTTRMILGGTLSVVGFLCVGFLAMAIFGDTDRMQVVLWAFGGGIGGALIGSLGLTLLFYLLYIAIFLAAIPGAVLAWSFVFVLKNMFRFHLRKNHPEWLNEDGELIVEIYGEGIWIRGTKKEVYVVDPSLRRNGLTDKEAIPRFTFSQLTRKRKIAEDVTKASMAVAATGVALVVTNADWETGEVTTFDANELLASLGDSLSDDTASGLPVINPTTGLPMVDNAHAGIDVGGNTYGHSDTVNTGFDAQDSYHTGSGLGSGGNGFSDNPW